VGELIRHYGHAGPDTRGYRDAEEMRQQTKDERRRTNKASSFVARPSSAQ